MKTIIILALAVCIINAAQFNSTEYHLGLSNTLGLNSTQISDGFHCIDGIGQLVDDIGNIVRTAKEGALQEIFSYTAKLIGDYKYVKVSDCAAYSADLAAYNQAHANLSSASSVNQAVEFNFLTYGPEIAKQVATWAQYLAMGEDYQAGQTEAYIMQILIGYVKPEVLPVPQLNSSKIVSYNASVFYPEFYKAFYSAFGYTNQTAVDIFVQCGLQMNNLVLDIVQLRQEYAQSTDFQQSIGIITEAIDSVMSTIGSCQESFAIELEIAAPVVQKFKAAPLVTIGQMVFNYAYNMPELVQLQQQLVVDVEQGEYDLAGEIGAQQEKIVLQGLMN